MEFMAKHACDLKSGFVADESRGTARIQIINCINWRLKNVKKYNWKTLIISSRCIAGHENDPKPVLLIKKLYPVSQIPFYPEDPVVEQTFYFEKDLKMSVYFVYYLFAS